MTDQTASILAAVSISRSPLLTASTPAGPASMAGATGCGSAPLSLASTACAATCRVCRSPNGRISSGCRMPLTLTLSPLSRGEGTCPLPRPARGERVRVKGETVLVHSSDIHIDDRRGTEGLEAVLDAARALRADVVLLAGDTFESNQLVLLSHKNPT